jgi:hypothetical protein
MTRRSDTVCCRLGNSTRVLGGRESISTREGTHAKLEGLIVGLCCVSPGSCRPTIGLSRNLRFIEGVGRCPPQWRAAVLFIFVSVAALSRLRAILVDFGRVPLLRETRRAPSQHRAQRAYFVNVESGKHA